MGSTIHYKSTTYADSGIGILLAWLIMIMKGLRSPSLKKGVPDFLPVFLGKIITGKAPQGGFFSVLATTRCCFATRSGDAVSDHLFFDLYFPKIDNYISSKVESHRDTKELVVGS
ncbi:MAG: hypothetical protein R3231_01585 [bacterium]|nr:hypothetical protein [bacterium]